MNYVEIKYYIDYLTEINILIYEKLLNLIS